MASLSMEKGQKIKVAKETKAQASVSGILGARAMGQGTGKMKFSLKSVEIQEICLPHAKQTSQRGRSRPGTRQPRLTSKSRESVIFREGSDIR